MSEWPPPVEAKFKMRFAESGERHRIRLLGAAVLAAGRRQRCLVVGPAIVR